MQVGACEGWEIPALPLGENQEKQGKDREMKKEHEEKTEQEIEQEIARRIHSLALDGDSSACIHGIRHAAVGRVRVAIRNVLHQVQCRTMITENDIDAIMRILEVEALRDD